MKGGDIIAIACSLVTIALVVFSLYVEWRDRRDR